MKRKTGTERGKLKAGTESGNGKLKAETEKAGNWKWSSELNIISGDSEHSSLGLWTSYV